MSKDYDILLEKEKVFENYRNIKVEIIVSKALAKKTLTKIKKLEKDQEAIKNLIAVMIEHNCDPVEAKLKYVMN